jgi:hypothetical protein
VSSEAQPDVHLIAEVKVLRPVMGHVRSRLFAHLLAIASVRPPEIPPKSFTETILPLTPMGSGFCAENLHISMKTRIRKGRGRWYQRPHNSRFGTDEWTNY